MQPLQAPPVTVHNQPLPGPVLKYLRFQCYNNAAVSILAGVPMLLFAKQLEGSNTVLGLIASLPPLAVMLQIPAATLLQSYSYKKVFVAGFFLAGIASLFIAVLPFLPRAIDAPTRLALLIAGIGTFHSIRAVSSTGAWAWIMQLMPESQRGKFLSHEQIVGNAAGLVMMLLAALALEADSQTHIYGCFFLFASLLSFKSWDTLRSIPDVPVDVTPASPQPVPWLAILRFRPFQKLIIFSAVFFFAFSAVIVFWMPLMRDELRCSQSTILLMVASCQLCAIGTMNLFSHILDRTGSRPVLYFALTMAVVHLLLWGLVAAGTLPFYWLTMALIAITSALAFNTFMISLARLMMHTVPPTGRTHFFALFNVSNNLMLGFMPVVWGMMLDFMGDWEIQVSIFELNRFSLLYLILAGTMVLCLLLIRTLREQNTARPGEVFEHVLLHIPIRAWARLNNWIYSRF
ncbi:MAG: MFS transporter [Verrucomicrobiae bacterium]|nr:MFS transporter [Verrucomicrobiae bacterium]